MGYQALLFCPDEKTARTLTQVLSELEFTVEPCAEPFVAVKQLMGGHFDAVVVDCDNEQNATLLFKSAKNSAANQGSLAVAVVEGQAGVAKAFRIGANLVLTKPINVEQAKGTLRVARGLLRKGEPVKPGAPAPTPAKPAASTIPAAPKPPQTLSAATQQQRLTPKPAPQKAAWPVPPAAAAQSSAPAANAQEAKSTPPPAPAISDPAAAASAIPSVPPREAQAAAAVSLSSAAPSISFGSGAASAPAPARIADSAPAIHAEPAVAVPAISEPQIAASAGHAAPAEMPVPSFTFGGANAPAESSGGSKKILLGVAAAAFIAAMAYLAWTQFGNKTSTPTGNPTAAISSTSSPRASSASTPANSPKATTSAPANDQPAGAADTQLAEPSSVNSGAGESAAPKHSASTHGAANSKPSNAEPASKSAPQDNSNSEPVDQPIMVKNGTAAPSKTKAASSDVAAPSMAGIAAPGSNGSLSNLLGNESAPKPVLQTLSVSQGVSQGLIVKKVQPNYPANAMRMRVEGAVQLMATISKTGEITSVKIMSGEPMLTHAAADAVKQWKYKPYLLNGEPVEIQTQITVNFKLPK